jgi:PAS domain S-box-containing protein
MSQDVSTDGAKLDEAPEHVSEEAAESARAAQQLLSAIVQGSEDAAFVKDGSGTFLMANAAMAKALGVVEVEGVIGRRDADLLPKTIAEGIRLSDRLVVEGGAAQSIEHEFGGRILLFRKIPWRDAGGHVIGLMGFARDVTERRYSAALLQRSEDLLDLAQEAGRVGIFEWQVQLGKVRLSPKFLSLYGLERFDGRYDSWFRCVYREDQPRIADLLENAFAAQAREVNAEFRIVCPSDGALKWMESRNLVFYDAAGRPLRVVGVNVDVTERKRAMMQLRAFTETLEDRVKERTRELEAENEARKQAEEALRQAQKMEAVGQLTGGIAHDFNNLLTVVLGGLDAIGRQIPALAGSPAAARIDRARDMALQGVSRAVTLTNRLLAFSRQQPLAPKPIDANQLVAGISELLRRALGESVSLETVLAGGLWRSFADANQLENALINLVVNARDAMADGGKVTIETANYYLDEAYVAALAEPVEHGQYVMIAVTDTGAGMDAATIGRAFEPFFTTKETGKGTGLGLSQVYGFVRQSAGHVRIYSEPAEGTTVKIYLPRYLRGEDQQDSTPARESVRRAEAERILVVEDDDALRAFACDTLRELGYCVLEASSGAAALDILDEGEAVDLLFTDIVMPGGLNGRQLADEAVRRRPGLKVLFTTGYTRNAIVHQGRLDPGVQMISKPFSFDDLGAKVRTLLDSAPR